MMINKILGMTNFGLMIFVNLVLHKGAPLKISSNFLVNLNSEESKDQKKIKKTDLFNIESITTADTIFTIKASLVLK